VSVCPKRIHRFTTSGGRNLTFALKMVINSTCLIQLYDLQLSKSVAVLDSALPAADDYYRAISIVSLVEYSVGPDDVTPAEKVCCTSCRVVFTNQLSLLITHRFYLTLLLFWSHFVWVRSSKTEPFETGVILVGLRLVLVS